MECLSELFGQEAFGASSFMSEANGNTTFL